MLRTICLAGALAVGACAMAPAASMPGGASCTTGGAVQWLRPADPEERAAQDAWCAAVGQPVIRSAAVGVAADSLLVVTWNVKVGGGDVRRFVASLRAGELTGGARVEHFAVLLQETHREGDAVPVHSASTRRARRIASRLPDGRREAIDDVARDLGLSLVYVPSMRNGAEREDRGNAILATLPLHDPMAAELPLARQRRVAVTATAAARRSDGREWRLQLTTVHLENWPAVGLTGMTDRGRQIAWLLAELPHAPQAVLGGDFNTWVRGAAEPAFRLAQRALPDAGTPPDDPTHAMPALPDLRLDYLLARLPGGRTGEQTRVRSRFGSDHHAVLAWVHPG